MSAASTPALLEARAQEQHRQLRNDPGIAIGVTALSAIVVDLAGVVVRQQQQIDTLSRALSRALEGARLAVQS